MPYIGKAPASGIRSRFIYTATAAQTTFTGADGNGKTLGYTDGEYVDVYLNGVLLDPADYTATSKTSVVLDSGATVSDIVEIVVYDTFSVFNGTFTGDLTVDGDTLFVDASADAVGIGTASPNRDLQIGDNTGSLASLSLQGSTTSNCQIYFGDNAATSAEYAGLIRYEHSTDSMQLWTGSTERMRIDSSGTLLVGKTSTTFNTQGSYITSGGILGVTRADGELVSFNRTGSDGTIMGFYKGGSTVGSIDCSGGDMQIGTGDVGISFNDGNNALLPYNPSTQTLVDNFIDLGMSSYRYDDVYATNGTIQTSDQNEKQQIASLTDSEITAAKAISKLFKTFKWNDSVLENGDNARTHSGVIAQDVQSAMTDAGLDAGDYAFFISTTWWETRTDVPAIEAVAAQDAVLDDDGNVVTEAVEAVEAREAHTRTDIYKTADEAPEGATERTRLGIRYPELLAFIGAATEQRLTSIEARLTALEA